jgi:FkbM family methyltransferase
MLNLEKSRPIEMIFDIGANEGQTVTRFRKMFPSASIYAFECDEITFSRLSEKTKVDHSITTFNIALGEKDGQATLYRNTHHATNSLLTNSSKISRYTSTEFCTPVGETTVPVMRLDTFCRNQEIPIIDILKIDTQGFEKNILLGAGERLHPDRIRGLFLEVLFVDLYQNQTWFHDVMEILHTRGYRFFGLDGIVHDKANGWKWADAMFIADH